MKIYFIEKSIEFSGNDLHKPNLGGSEKTLINISTEVAKCENFEVKVFNLTNEKEVINNVEWNNLNNCNLYKTPDYLIAMSDVNLLNYFDCTNNFLWSHSVQSFEKFIRKKQLLSFLKKKPKLILEGEYHYKTRSFITSFYGKKKLPIAADNDFIESPVDILKIPIPKAIFTTRSDRNLEFLLNCWSEIKLRSNNAFLLINPPYKLSKDQINLKIKLRNKGNKFDLINELSSSRVMLNPGHKGEVFCLAAEEALRMCVPIVTMGHGALKERVVHNVNGFLANSKKEFIDYAIKILNDDDLYLNLKKKMYNLRHERTYKDVAKNFISIIKTS